MRKLPSHTTGEAAHPFRKEGDRSSLVGMVRKEPGEDSEAEAAQEAACPLSLGPINEGLLPKARHLVL